MKKSAFTLIEMLVVIGIIGILAAMIMPALGGARASGQRTECINNKHQVSLAALNYAGDNNAMVPYLVEGKNYAYVLTGKGSTASKKVTSYIPEDTVLICNQSTDRKLASDAANASGMLNATGDWYKDKIEKLGRFRSKKDANNVSYSVTKMLNPAGMILFADTFKKASAGASPYWSFLPAGADSDAYVCTIHLNTAAVAFADGSAKAMTAPELKGTDLEISDTLSDDMSKVQSN